MPRFYLTYVYIGSSSLKKYEKTKSDRPTSQAAIINQQVSGKQIGSPGNCNKKGYERFTRFKQEFILEGFCTIFGISVN